jgi:hypothetical protein
MVYFSCAPTKRSPFRSSPIRRKLPMRFPRHRRGRVVRAGRRQRQSESQSLVADSPRVVAGPEFPNYNAYEEGRPLTINTARRWAASGALLRESPARSARARLETRRQAAGMRIGGERAAREEEQGERENAGETHREPSGKRLALGRSVRMVDPASRQSRVSP